jgi:hypothetical protein
LNRWLLRQLRHRPENGLWRRCGGSASSRASSGPLRNRWPWQSRDWRSCSRRSRRCGCNGFCCYRWGRRRRRGDRRYSSRGARDWCSHRNRRPGWRSGWRRGCYCRRFWRWFGGHGRRDWTRRGR